MAATNNGQILAIIGCGKTKLDHAAPAADLYCGQLFKAARQWAEQNADRWLIASAQHGLVRPDTILDPYDRTLHGLGRDQVRQWGAWCQADLSQYVSESGGLPAITHILAGQDYLRPLLQFTALKRLAGTDRISTPLQGLGIGHRLQWLAEQQRAAAACC